MNKTWLDRNRNVVFVGVVFVAVVGAVLFYFGRSEPEPIALAAPTVTATLEPCPTSAPLETATPAPVRIYVTGAVLNSDVYFLPAGSIIKDVIEAAGGFSPDAAPEQINLALELKDQQQIHIPHINEKNPPPPIQGGVDELTPADNQNQNNPASSIGGKLNLNTATLEQFDSLPGIGPAIAQRIIDYRQSNNGFTTIEEITQVSGIGESTFAKIKDLIVVE